LTCVKIRKNFSKSSTIFLLRFQQLFLQYPLYTLMEVKIAICKLGKGI
jgi:hypothetical protein